MDIKTSERVLDTILRLAGDNHTLGKPVAKIRAELPDLPEAIIISTLDHLEKIGCITVSGDDNRSYAMILDYAVGYLREIQEKRDNESSKKWSDRRWSLFQLLIGSIIGAIFTLLFQHLSKVIQ